MKTLTVNKALWLIAAALFLSLDISAQKTKPKPRPAVKQIIFAVLNDGKRIEPVAVIEDGKLKAADEQPLADYYRAKRSYALIFGGKPDGNLSVSRSNIGTECGGNSADVISSPVKTQLKGLVMALATNAKVSKPGSGVRRRPTPAERSDIEGLVRAELIMQNTPAATLKNLRYHNLTALDLDNDGTAEFVGSYWVAPNDKERRTLFFIAEKGEGDKYRFTHQDYEEIKPDDVMSGDVKDLDTGVGHELLLDVFDYDNDGVSEIFTIAQAFEGNNYYAYRRENRKWTKVLESYIYRCAY